MKILIIIPTYNEDKNIVARFRREARAMAALDHPNIVTVYSIGHTHNLHYFVMKLLPGETLAYELKRQKLGYHPPLQITQILHLLIQVLNGLEHAHQKGLLHRDIKPGNLMLYSYQKITIMDFGIVKVLDENYDSLSLKTAHGKIFGTPEYMPPEQAMGNGEYSPASDLYALAVVGYEMLCGVLPYKGDTPLATIIKHVRAPIPAFRGHAKDRYPLVESIIRKAMSKNPLHRYQSAGEFRNALAEALRQTKSLAQLRPVHDMPDQTQEDFSLETDFQDYLDSNLDEDFQDFDSLPPISNPDVQIGSIFNQPQSETSKPSSSVSISKRRVEDSSEEIDQQSLSFVPPHPTPYTLYSQTVPPVPTQSEPKLVPTTREFTSLNTPTATFESETNFQLKFKSSDDSAVEVPTLTSSLSEDDPPPTISIEKLNSGRSGHYKRLPIKRK